MHHVRFVLGRGATVLAMFAFVLSSVTLSAQTASIEVRVADPQGGTIGDATVTLDATAPASQRTARTTEFPLSYCMM